MFARIVTLILTLSLVLQVNAQAIKALTVGKLITKTSKIDLVTVSEALGQIIEQNITSATVAESLIKEVKPNSMVVHQKTTKMKLSMKAMQQEMSYDSEHPDENSRINQAAEILNKVTIITTNENGVVTNTQADEALKGLDMLSGFNTTVTKGQPVDFLLNVNNKSIGSSWTEKVDADGSVSNTTYTIKSISGGIAEVTFTGDMTITKATEAQGMEIKTKTTGTMSGTAQVNVANNIIIKRNLPLL